MITHVIRASLVAAACACLFASSAVAQTLTPPKQTTKTPVRPAATATTAARPAPAMDPWAKVPALPTVCYDGTDGFGDKIDAARASLDADVERQKAVNSQIEEQFKSIDPMEKAQRMQQWMMSNPQEAARVLGGQQQAGMQAQADNPQLTADHLKFNTERESLKSKYTEDLKRARAPAEAKYGALDKRLSAAGCSFGDTECSVPESAWAERDAILRERDAAYQATCARYWTAAGPMQDYAKRYRTWMAQRWLAHAEQSDAAMRSQFAIMDTPGAAWKSTIPQEHVSRYLGEIGQLYGLRDEAPTCTANGCPRY
jgi:hypothetical protein